MISAMLMFRNNKRPEKTPLQSLVRKSSVLVVPTLIGKKSYFIVILCTDLCA